MMDPGLPKLVGAVLAVLLIGLTLRRLNQPHVVAYLVAGVVLGPHGLALFSDAYTVERLGHLGVILLLFSVGMEISLPRLLEGWKVATLGTLLQILLSVLVVLGIGYWLDWPLARIVLLGFVVSLSSTAVSVALLRERGALDSPMGRDVMGIMVVQDLALVPMLMILGLFAGERASAAVVTGQVVGGVAIVALVVYLARHGRIRLPFGAALRADREYQVFSAALLCLGFALFTGLLGLSTALGAFVAGLVVASARETRWVTENLDPFRVILVALFFVSVGMVVDVGFAVENGVILMALVLAVLLTNTLVNALIVRAFGLTWRESFLAGSLLAQIGEFSFVLAAIGRSTGIISDYGYQATLSVIFLSLVLSPVWVRIFGGRTPDRR